jgi:hypothetical protein
VAAAANAGVTQPRIGDGQRDGMTDGRRNGTQLTDDGAAAANAGVTPRMGSSS